MSSIAQPAPTSKWMVWTGCVVSAIPVLMLLFSGGWKLMKPDSLMTEFDRLGYGQNLILVIGVLEVACTVIYLIPRTAVLGAILLTGYLGGATATHVRIGDPSFFAPVIVGVLVWLGLYLRDSRLRVLLPLKS
jgi:DoxX-like family